MSMFTNFQINPDGHPPSSIPNLPGHMTSSISSLPITQPNHVSHPPPLHQPPNVPHTHPSMGMPLLQTMGINQHLAAHLSQATQQAVAQQQAAAAQQQAHVDQQQQSQNPLTAHIGQLQGHPSVQTSGLPGQIQSMSDQLAEDHMTDQPKRKRGKTLNLTCDVCGKTFDSRAKLHQHSRSHDKSRHVTCHECGQVFHYPQSLKLHYERVHMGREGEQCPLCPRKFRYKYTVETHLFNDHGQKKHQCEICGSQIMHLKDFNIHMKKHKSPEDQDEDLRKAGRKRKPKEAKVLTCEVCGKSFDSRPKLYQHSRIHDESRHVSCEICGRTFHFPKSLKDHYTRHHGRVPEEKCPICPQKFMDQYAVETHLFRVHGHKGHTCEICGFQYIHLKDRERHMSIHDKALMAKTEPTASISTQPKLNEDELKEEFIENSSKPQENSIPSFSLDLTGTAAGTSKDDFKCPKCSLSLETPEELFIHLKKEHAFDEKTFNFGYPPSTTSSHLPSEQQCNPTSTVQSEIPNIVPSSLGSVTSSLLAAVVNATPGHHSLQNGGGGDASGATITEIIDQSDQHLQERRGQHQGHHDGRHQGHQQAEVSHNHPSDVIHRHSRLDQSLQLDQASARNQLNNVDNLGPNAGQNLSAPHPPQNNDSSYPL